MKSTETNLNETQLQPVESTRIRSKKAKIAKRIFSFAKNQINPVESINVIINNVHEPDEVDAVKRKV